jgi:hypothetical protein
VVERGVVVVTLRVVVNLELVVRGLAVVDRVVSGSLQITVARLLGVIVVTVVLVLLTGRVVGG